RSPRPTPGTPPSALPRRAPSSPRAARAEPAREARRPRARESRGSLRTRHPRARWPRASRTASRRRVLGHALERVDAPGLAAVGYPPRRPRPHDSVDEHLDGEPAVARDGRFEHGLRETRAAARGDVLDAAVGPKPSPADLPAA